MAQNIIDTKIREAYDTEANWIKYNPVLLSGQLAYSSDKYGKYKIGNGASRWSQLQYATLGWGDITEKPSTFSPSTHTHNASQITDIGNASVKYATTAGAANAVAWDNVSGKPTSMKNPYALTISNFNNTKNVQYDGSSTQAVRLNAQLLYGASDSAIAMANENSSTNTRYVKLLDLTSHNSWQRTNQQFLIATRNLSFLLNIYVSSTDTAKFSRYNISYIPLSSNIEIHRFLTGIVHVDNTKDRFELWYEQQQWTSSVSVIPLGRSYEVNSGGYHFNGYITNSSSEGITTKPKFDISIAIEKIMPVLYNGTGNAIDGAMTQQAVTIALETRALKEHSHTIANITNLQSALDGKAPTTHEHNFLRVSDTRNENPTPNNDGFKKNSVAFDFKSAAKINSPTNNTYVGLMSFAPWSKTSGGNGYQMAFGYINNTMPKLMLRTADLEATTWGAWYKVYTSADKPTLSELGAAASSHTHNYAGSSSAGGAANSAIKLATARTINGISFDGTKNIEIPNNYSKQLTSEDLNTLLTPGNYFAAGGNTVKNKPSSVENFGLVMYKTAAGHIAQKLHGSNNIIYYRRHDGTSFNSWSEIYSSVNKPTPSEIGAAASSHSHSNYATTTNLSLANQRIDAHEKELGVHKTLIDGKAPSNHSHNTIRDFKDGEDISISTSILVTPDMGSIFDFIISGTQYGANKLVTMSSNQLGRCHAHTISQITDFPNIKAITNSQIDSLASL